MASSSDSFSSALSYALEQLGTPNLTLKNSRSPSRQYTKEILCSYGYQKDLAIFKSICYQALPFVIEYKKGQRDSCAVLVVSPLVSLMIDHVESLRARGAKASLLLLEVLSSHLLWLQNLLSLFRQLAVLYC